MNINEKIFEIMEKKNIKNADLAKHLNVKNNVITNWHNRGTEPPIKYIIPICELLDITVYELLGIENENKIQEAYDAADPGTQAAVRKLLDIKDEEQKDQEELYTSRIG